MAKKQESPMGKRVINAVLAAGGIYFTILGILSTFSQSWRSFFIALGLALIITGTIGFSKIK